MSLPIDSEWRLLSLSLIVSLFKWDRPIFKMLSRNHTFSNLFSWTYGMSKWDKFLPKNCNWKLSTYVFRLICIFWLRQELFMLWWACKRLFRNYGFQKKALQAMSLTLVVCPSIIGSSVVPWLIMPSATRYLWRSRPLQPKMNWTCKFKQKLNNVVNEGWLCLLKTNQDPQKAYTQPLCS